jgi:hypothetical protein
VRRGARRAAAEGRPFTDTDMFASGGAGGRDLIDEMVDSLPMTDLRGVIGQVIAVLGLTEMEVTQVSSPFIAPPSPSASDASAIPIPVNRARSKPRAVPMPGTPLVPSKPAAPLGPTDRRGPASAKSVPPAPPAIGANKAEADAPPQPDEEFAFIEEVSGRI